MHRVIRVRLLVAALCLIVSLPSAAAAPATPTIGQQREQVLFWPQAQREAQFRQMAKLFPSDLAPRGTHVHELPPGKPLPLGGSTSLANYMEQHHLAGDGGVFEGEEQTASGDNLRE